MQQIRAFNPRSATLAARSLGREAKVRHIRGFDDRGVQLFSIPACTSPRESSRASLDQRAVTDRLTRHGAKLTRIEIDQIAGGHADYVLRSDGTMTQAFASGGSFVTFGG